MTVPQNFNRQSLLNRGWYVPTEIETAFLGLSGRAHDLLIIIKHFQGDRPDAFPSQEHLANVLRASVRTIQRALSELRRKGALILRRTGRASRYGVLYCRATLAELRILLGGEVAIPETLVVTSDTTHPVASDTPLACAPPYKEPLTKNQQHTPSLREGADAAAPDSQTQTPEAEMRDEMDPTASLGLWDAQGPAESPSGGLDGLLPAEEVRAAPRQPQRRPRTQAQRDAAGALAAEFDALVRRQLWAGPSPVNKSALARNLSQWRRDGLSGDQIRAMMERFCSEGFPHRPNRAPWIDFISRRHQLLAAATRAQDAQAMEEHRYESPEYWLGSMAGGGR